MEDNPLNREKNPTLPNIVPASFSPVPEQYAAPVTQELRSKQARLTEGYTLARVSNLEIQFHKALYKREPHWRDYMFGDEPRMYSQEQSDDMLRDAIRIAKTAQTIMKDRISEWAGNYSETEMGAALPDIWNKFIQIVQGPAEEAEETEAVSTNVEIETDDETVKEEDALAPEDMAPAVADRPEIPGDAPKSEVVAPDEMS